MSDEKRPAESKDEPSESEVPKNTKKVFFSGSASADDIAKALMEGGTDKK